MLSILLLLAVMTAQDWTLDPHLVSNLSEKDLARGKALYKANCQRCHGANGDDTSMEGITPLGGLSLRLGDPRNRNFGGPSFRARGRIYSADEARVLMGYILTLRGEKGFARADALVSPYLLDRKRVRRTYLIIDARSEAEFRKSHIPGAASLPPRAFAALVRPSLSPDLNNRIVIAYDEGSGLQAARIWRAVFRSGHRAAAVLDGGFKRWVDEDRDITSAATPSLPTSLLVNASSPRSPSKPTSAAQRVLTLNLDWRKTVAETGLQNASELTECLGLAGFKGPGCYRLARYAERDLVALELHLLGFSVEEGLDSIHVKPDPELNPGMASRTR